VVISLLLLGVAREFALGAATATPGQSNATAAKPAKDTGGQQSSRPSDAKIETPMATDERLALRGWWPTKRAVSREDFVGSAECARCHAKKSVRQAATPMARAAMPAAGSEILRQHNPASLRLGAYGYEISSREGIPQYSVSDTTGTVSAPLLWAFGLGSKGQTYIYQLDGFYYESRLSFYKGPQALDLTSGHRKKAPANLADALGRLIDPDTLRRCFGCHTTAATTNAGFDPSRLVPGVACEACHGPGARHAVLMDAEKKEEGLRAIFDPRDLSPVAMVDFCGACHRTWNDVYEMGATGVANARFQPYRLENSRCWGDGDARLTCVACHDPHEELVRDPSWYDSKCAACHAAAPKKPTKQQPGRACPVGKKDCVTCHMPFVMVPEMHAPFADHRIRVVRAGDVYPE
jgi:hypothetical protein